MNIVRRLRTSRFLWLLTRDARGILHRLQGRRIAHIMHIGKTGGLALNSALRPYLKSGDYEIGIYGHEYDLTHFPRGEKVVFFLRDPVDRFVSGFNYRRRRGFPRVPAPWSTGEEAAFARFATPNELALALSSEDDSLRAAAVDAMRSIEHVRSPQWTWFRDRSYFLSRESDVLFIGFQETLSTDFDILKRILGLPDAVRLPVDEVVANRSPISADKRLEEVGVRNLKAWYRRDYEFLDLCRQIRERKQWEFRNEDAPPSPDERSVASAPASGPLEAL